MVFRVKKTKDYTVMSNFHLREKNMSLKAKGLLSWMLSNNDDWDYSIAGIVANCKENETAIKSALDELREFGYLEVKKISPNKDISVFHYEYIVHEQPIENQDIENLVLENQVQSNTNISNTKKEENTITINSNIGEEFFGKIEKSKNKRGNLYSKCYDLILEYTNNLGLQSALADYLTIRLQMKDKPLYGVNQWKGLLNKLAKMDNQLDVVNNSIENGWASFYPPKSYNKKGKEKFGEDDNIKSVKGEFDSSGETF